MIQMKRLILIVWFLPFSLFSQNVGYEKSTQVEKVGDREFLVHSVLKGQTLYAISKLYEVPIDSIYQFNPQIREGMKWGQTIRIPMPIKAQPHVNNPVKKESEVVPVPAADTVPAEKDTLLATCTPGQHKGPFHVALIMPLYLREVDSIPSEMPENPDDLDQIRPLRFIQFYEGARMALDSLEAMQVSIELSVYDLDDDTIRASKLLKKAELKKMDLIIGLLYGQSYQMVALFGKQNNIPVVNPLSNKAQFLENNPMVILSNPTVSTMGNCIAAFLVRQYPESKIILMSSSKESERKSMKLIRDQLDKEFDKMGKEGDIYLFVGNAEISKVENILSNTSKNAVFLVSSDELFVAALMPRLKSWASAHDIIVFGMPGWLDFQSIETQMLVKLNFHTFGTTFIDYNRQETKDFIMKFRKAYQTEPQDLAFQGYDNMYYFLKVLGTYGPAFMQCLPEFEYQGLQSRFVFRRTGNNGYENSWLNIFKLVDYQLINAND